MSRDDFRNGLHYFAGIGGGYMMIQIAYMQLFSVYLGHPTYALAVLLFAMILFTGVGASLSERLPVEASRGPLYAIPLAIAVSILLASGATRAVIDATVEQDLLVRCLVVIGMVAPISLLLGCCFPIGMRLVGRISGDAMPWMWGLNGASGVLASVVAVYVSMWGGISLNLRIAAVLYATLAIPAVALWRAGQRRAAAPEG
jgi:hypothetical protein